MAASTASVAWYKAGGPVLGIVIGSTNDRIWIYRNKRVEIITDETGVDPIPDVIAFTDSGPEFGKNAKDLMSRSLKNTVSGCIRLIGRSKQELSSDLRGSSIRVLDEDTIEVKVRGSTQKYTTTELLGLQIEFLKETAEKYLGVQFRRTVITVPFAPDGESPIKEAVEYAGLVMDEKVDCPIAAVTAYDLDKKDGHYLVFHCGSRTTSAAVVFVNNEDSEVQWSRDGFGCSGESMDQILLNHCLNLFHEQNGCDMRGDAAAVSRLREEVQLAKVRLSSCYTTNIQITGLFEEKDFSAKIMRSQFEAMCGKILVSAVKVMDEALLDMGITVNDVNNVILIGGSSKIPKLRSLTQSVFGAGKVLFDDTNMIVCHGSAAHADLVKHPLIPKKSDSTTSDRWIGIDFGTTNSSAAVCNDGQVDIIANESGKKITPSVVAFKTVNNQTEILIGDEANDFSSFDPRNSIKLIKLMAGRKYDDPDVQAGISDKIWSFVVEKGEDGRPLIRVRYNAGRQTMTPEFIASMIIRKLVSMVEPDPENQSKRP